MKRIQILAEGGTTVGNGHPVSGAMAPAQFRKRSTLPDLRSCATGDAEAERMAEGIEVLRAVLADAGFDPR
jgi:hypothetical protein